MKNIKRIIILIVGLCCLISPVSKAGDILLPTNEKQSNNNLNIVTTTETITKEKTTSKTITEKDLKTTEYKKKTTLKSDEKQKDTIISTKRTSGSSNKKSYNNDVAGNIDWQYTQNATYPIKYNDSSMNIKIDKVWYRHAWCYVAQVKMSNYSRMRSVCANGRFGNGTETCLQAAKRTDAVLAVNACHSNIEQNIPVVRDGKVCNMGWASCNFPACYNKYTGKLGSTYAMGLSCVLLDDAVEEKKLTDGFCFGPEFDMENLNNNDDGQGGGRAQRTFIGTNGQPGNIIIVVSEGRFVDDVSAGLTYKECAEVLKHYGCDFGVPLDGGGSSTMVYKKQILNHLPSERYLVDFVIFK